MLGHGQFQLAQYAARMHAAAAPADDVQAPVVALVRPAVQFLSQALFSEMMRSARALSVAEQASSRAASLAASAAAAGLASPQMPTDTGRTSPSMRWSASTWMMRAFLGQ